MAKKLSTGKKNRKLNRKRNRPCQKRYVSENRRDVNKRRKAQIRANKFGHPVRIKVQGLIEVIKPKAGEKSPAR